MASKANINDLILDVFTRSQFRWTPGDLVRQVRIRQSGLSRKSILDALKELVAQGSLIYTHNFSSSQLELNYHLPVQVSPRIYLIPAGFKDTSAPGCVGIKLMDGTAFGGGDHPTTRISLRGIDHALSDGRDEIIQEENRLLDVGTGSGVLALAALKLGVAKAVGIDIDPVACVAARKNADLNHLADRFQVMSQWPEESSGQTYKLILANMRPPTMQRLFSKLVALSSPGAIWVLSGFRVDEQNGLEKTISTAGGRRIWNEMECGWVAWVLRWP